MLRLQTLSLICLAAITIPLTGCYTPVNGLGGGTRELSVSLSQEKRSGTTADYDRTNFSGLYSNYWKKNISLGVTVNASFTDEQDLIFTLFSPRYYYSIQADDKVALYAGPDLGFVAADGNAFKATSAGLTLGSKFYLWDNVALFGEYYTLRYSEVDGDRTADEDGLRMGLSVSF